MSGEESGLGAVPVVGIACGGTGGHLFPGLAVGHELVRMGCDVTLFVSQKEIDRHAERSARDMAVVTLPGVGLGSGGAPAFVAGLWNSFRAARAWCKTHRPAVVLGMGGFTSAGPVLAARSMGAATALHESNAIPGRANRWLAHWVDRCFVGFPMAARRLRHPATLVTGTPVRPMFRPMDPAAARMALNLHPERAVLLVMGGSQGASGINELVTAALGPMVAAVSGLQFLHLTGEAHCDGVRQTYVRAGLRAVVRPFLSEMELAMAAATVAVSRAGAASLAELAAMRLPAVLVPYPAAADNHQYWNARALVDVGAARLLEQRVSSPEDLAREVTSLLVDAPVRERMRVALAAAQTPHAAERVAVRIAALIEGRGFRGLTFRAVEQDESEFEAEEAGFGPGAGDAALGQRAVRVGVASAPVLSGGRA